MRALVPIVLTVLIDLLGFGIIIPLLPVYATAYGASETELGLLLASFSAMQLCFAPVWGRISDRVGRRPVLVTTLCGTAGAYLLFAFADGMTMLFVSRLLAGLFGANISVAFAYVADVTTKEDRTHGMGLIGAAFGLGFMIGPLVGGELSRFSTHAPGFAACALSLCAAAFALARLEEPARRSEQKGVLALARQALTDSRYGTLLVLSFLGTFAFATFEAMFTRFGLASFPGVFGLPGPLEHASYEDTLRSAPIAGRYLALVGLIALVVQGGLVRRIEKRLSTINLILIGPALLGLGFLLVALAPGLPFSESGRWWIVIAGCFVMPWGFGLNNPALNSLTSRAAPAAEQGAYLGISQSLSSLARMTAPPCAGLVFEHFGAASPFWCGCALYALACGIAWVYRTKHAASFR